MAIKKYTKKTNDGHKKYIVTRSGVKVSDNEYSSKEQASEEYGFWNRVITRYPDGTKLEIVEK
jgi:hypothetical protein